jgi:hypothetical protein
MTTKTVDANLDDEILKLANWLANEVDEYRCTYIPSLPLHELLAFIRPSQIDELGELLTNCKSDYFSDGVIQKIVYNGSDLVINVLPILRNFNIDPKLISEEYRGKENE